MTKHNATLLKSYIGSHELLEDTRLTIRPETRVGAFILIAIGIFFYMSFKVGAFRFDAARYSPYYVYCSDVTGVRPRTDVKIAGVTVGWVEKIEVVNHGQQASVVLMIDNGYVLRTDTYCAVRQDGLIGTRYIEINSGDPSLPALKPGDTLTKQVKAQMSFEQFMQQFTVATGTIQEITHSLKDVLSSGHSQGSLPEVLHTLHEVLRRLDDLVARNTTLVNDTLCDVKSIAQELKDSIPRISNEIHQLSETLSNDVIPSVKHNVEQVTTAIDRDLHAIAEKINDTSKPLCEIATKINNGTGLLGQVINDKSMYTQVKTTWDMFRSTALILDARFESLHSLHEQCKFSDAKGYFNAYIWPPGDYFGLIGVTTSLWGHLERFETTHHRLRLTSKRHELIPDHLRLSGEARLTHAPVQQRVIHEFDKLFLNLQLGRVYHNFAFRVGIFEGYAGIGIDYIIPFVPLTWLTTLEAFDFRGRNRISDDRPHVKWLNRIFFTNHLYLDFGLDDIISHAHTTGFLGVGLTFSTDDIVQRLTNTL